ncbi:hypothetical protein PHMEG_00034895 [Phytophthora megakarya]|uniref:Uncharacterized protein n=1 Tax=Phytophthora megakarya TaxID=4795 RepID=A0A225USM8_9STRA|nr:hypothetical protein PHMEG_00034895 [Phytophthora megakarya]
MENPTNFAMIHGSSKKTTVGHKVTKADAFKRLAEHLCEKSETPNLPLISSESMRRRWKTYKDKFVKTLAAKRSETGMGLTEKEMKKGLTVPAKLNKMCPHFSRMEDLFGEKSNITAASTTELGAVRSDEASDELISSDDANVHFGEGSPEFRFDGYTPPPGDSENVNTSNAFDSDRQCTGTPRYTDNCLGLSDDVMIWSS